MQGRIAPAAILGGRRSRFHSAARPPAVASGASQWDRVLSRARTSGCPGVHLTGSSPGFSTIDLAAFFAASPLPAFFQGSTRDVSVAETVAVLVILVLSLALHEVAHAWVAWKRGDPTAKDLGRITMDPLPHIDLWWTLILPGMLWFGSNGQMIFGGAKPVPVDFNRLKSPTRDMALVAFAGPLSNFVIACGIALLLKVLSEVLGVWTSADIGYAILAKGIQLNLLLAVFNLLPIPPLDGSRILTWLLPPRLREGYRGLEAFGLLIVLGFLWGMPQVSQPLLNDSIRLLWGWVNAIVTLGGLW